MARGELTQELRPAHDVPSHPLGARVGGRSKGISISVNLKLTGSTALQVLV